MFKQVIKKSVLFHRKYGGFTGGHLKVYDYFNHCLLIEGLNPEIYIDPVSDLSHLWKASGSILANYDPHDHDILFLAGNDWQALDNFPSIEEKKIVLNLIQHVRHADPSQDLFQYLRKRAIRICVSYEVAEAVLSTGICNGPVYVIPNGINFEILPASASFPSCDVVIAGLKQPVLANALSQELIKNGYSVDLLVSQLPRQEYLSRISRGRVVVTLPNSSEGFYLPALEAMAMGLLVVCPDCVGNRSFCRHRLTCMVPDFSVDSLAQSVTTLLADPVLASQLRRNSQYACRHYDIRREREDFGSLMRELISDSF
ncbi:MAG: glycosyltransferase family 4 protein [Cyanobium sp.]|nr:glycosyltransferase family 4 protein [Cyanobium sp.]